MPELPEVENVRLSLMPKVEHKTVSKLRMMRRDPIISHSAALPDLASLTAYRSGAIERRGKYLIWHLTAGPGSSATAPANVVLLIHFRMTGRLVFFDEHERSVPEAPHTHIVIELEDTEGQPAGELRWQDVRRFGCWELFSAEDFAAWTKGVKTLGPEPLEDNWDYRDLREFSVKHPHMPIASMLLDQRCIAGLGNIYVQELLFMSKLHPLTVGADISKEKWQELASYIRPLLQKAIAAGGTSFRDYVNADGEQGAYVHSLLAYGRKGEGCYNCGTVMSVCKCAGRTMCFCSECQKAISRD